MIRARISGLARRTAPASGQEPGSQCWPAARRATPIRLRAGFQHPFPKRTTAAAIWMPLPAPDGRSATRPMRRHRRRPARGRWSPMVSHLGTATAANADRKGLGRDPSNTSDGYMHGMVLALSRDPEVRGAPVYTAHPGATYATQNERRFIQDVGHASHDRDQTSRRAV